jgi:ribosome-binding factor A
MSIRTSRLAAVLQKDLARILQQKYQAPGTFLTVTRVDISPDLMNAKVFISVFAPQYDEKQIFEKLEQQTSAIRQSLASKIRQQVRRIPELHFIMDESAEHAEKMDRLFTQIHKEGINGRDGQE